MEIVVRGRHIDLSEQFRDRASAALERLDRVGASLMRIDVEVTKESNPRMAERAFTVELTGTGRGAVVRAEAVAGDKYAAFDEALDRMKERLRRAADRRRSLQRNGRSAPAEGSAAVDVVEEAVEPGVEPDADVVYEQGPVVVREKTHNTTPMTVEAAVDAMELVGHDFYLFLDADTGRPSVVYRRRGYDYGLIRLEVAAEQAAV